VAVGKSILFIDGWNIEAVEFTPNDCDISSATDLALLKRSFFIQSVLAV
jgi:hypothetical protein